MKNITLSAQEEAIEKARKIAAQQHSTLNEMFRDWLDTINNGKPVDVGAVDKLDTLWKRTGYLRVGEKLSRDEMNER